MGSKRSARTGSRETEKVTAVHKKVIQKAEAQRFESKENRKKGREETSRHYFLTSSLTSG